ncbi:MAG: hypothetical protein AABW79_01290 [Nanoarchaeota archaeon]
MRKALFGLSAIIFANSAIGSGMVSLGKDVPFRSRLLHSYILKEDMGLRTFYKDDKIYEFEVKEEEGEKQMKLVILKNDMSRTPIACLCDGIKNKFDGKLDLYISFPVNPRTGCISPTKSKIGREHQQEYNKAINLALDEIEKEIDK